MGYFSIKFLIKASRKMINKNTNAVAAISSVDASFPVIKIKGVRTKKNTNKAKATIGICLMYFLAIKYIIIIPKLDTFYLLKINDS